MKYTIGIDVGTSGTKTVLFDRNGAKIASALMEYPMMQPKNGWAEQSPTDWWNAAAGTIRQVVTESAVDPADIVGVGLTGQMHGLVMLDEDNNVLRPAIIWCDQRTAAECADIEAAVGHDDLIEITCNPALTGFTASKILWVRKNQPDIYAKCRHILLPKDYIRFMLTGNYATDVSDASGMQLLDIGGRCWSDTVLKRLDIDPSLLGTVLESPDVSGVITEEAAALTGLCAGTPVAAGAGDNAAAAVGVGVVKEGTAFTTIGTSGVVFAHTDRITLDRAGRIHTFCCAVPGAWHVMGVTQAAGLSLRWLRDTVCTDEIARAEAQGVDPYVIMDKEAEASGIGANRLLYLPYLMGERTPHLDPNARGAFIGLSAMHNRGDLTRAVLEGVCFSLKDCLSVFGEMDLRPQTMCACGGGAKSPLWRNLLAQVFDTPIHTTVNDEGPAFGAAILAMVCAGLYDSVPAACDALIRQKSSLTPDANDAAAYAKYYSIYRGLYSHLKNDYAALAQL